MEAEWHTLQVEGFSEATIRTTLAAIRDSSRKVYKSRWESFTSWCGERGENLISSPLKHVLDFLQLKAETLSVNTLNGYVTAISRRHATVQVMPLGMDPSIR